MIFSVNMTKIMFLKTQAKVRYKVDFRNVSEVLIYNL